MAITNTDFQNVAVAISAYADEAYTSSKKLNATGVVLLDPTLTPVANLLLDNSDITSL